MRAACGIVQPISKRRLAPAPKVLEAEVVDAEELAEPREPGADRVGGEREDQRARSGQGPRGCGQTKANRSLFAQAHLGSGCTKLPPLDEGGSAACPARIAPLRQDTPVTFTRRAMTPAADATQAAAAVRAACQRAS
ncbi:MAG: hypothetical protein RLZZ413_3387 [Pseudomonadota bacterium]|jgi:hypothetical protein